MKKVISLLLSVMLLMSVSSCAVAESKVFGYTAMDLTNPFHIAIRDKIQAMVEANGDRLVSVDGALDQTKQNNAIEDMVTQNISALFLNPVDSQGVLPALEACKEANIPVINLDSAVDALDMVATYISSNNYQAGQLCGEELVRLFPEGAKICLLENPLAESVVQRVKGLEDAIAGSKVEIVDRKSISTYEAILSSSEDLAQAHPDMNAFWGLNDDVGLIILGILESAGMKDVKVISVDGSPSAKKSIADGGLYATAAQSPIAMAEKAVECAYALLSGGAIESVYSIDTSLVNPENVGQFDLENWN